MRTLSRTLLLALVLCAATFGAEPPDDKTAAVRAMFQVMGMDQQMAGGFEAMMPMIDQLASQLQLDAQGKEQLKQVYRDWFDHDIDRQAILEQVIVLYAEAFTLEEITALTDFYTTPVGQKFLEKSPQLMQAGARIGMEEAQRKQGKLMERLRPFLEKAQ